MEHLEAAGPQQGGGNKGDNSIGFAGWGETVSLFLSNEVSCWRQGKRSISAWDLGGAIALPALDR